MPSHVIEYIKHLEALNLRPSYVYAQRGTLRRLTQFLHPDPTITATVQQLAAYLESRNYGPGARSAEISHLRRFYGWAVDQGLIRQSPARRLAKPRRQRRLPRPIPADALALALKNAPPRESAILHLAAYAGLRCCEIAQLRAEDIDRSRGLVIINESKGGHAQVVALGKTLSDALHAADLPKHGWLFPSSYGTGHLSRSRIGQIANQYMRDLGLPYTAHQARHSFGTMAYQASGRDLRVTQELLRHRDPSSTAGYTQITPGEMAAVVNRLPVLSGVDTEPERACAHG